MVNLSFCYNISAGDMQDILCYITETCFGVKEVHVTVCSNETVLWTVATRARASFGVLLALDLFALIRSMGEGGNCYSFSNLGSLLHARPPLLLFDPVLTPRKNAMFQAVGHGTDPEVSMLLSLSFGVGYEDVDDTENEGDEGDIWTYDMNEEDSQGNAPLLHECRSGNLEITEVLVCTGAGVGDSNKRGDTPLLAAVGVGKLELAEMLVSKGASRLQSQKTGTP